MPEQWPLPALCQQQPRSKKPLDLAPLLDLVGLVVDLRGRGLGQAASANGGAVSERCDWSCGSCGTHLEEGAGFVRPATCQGCGQADFVLKSNLLVTETVAMADDSVGMHGTMEIRPGRLGKTVASRDSLVRRSPGHRRRHHNHHRGWGQLDDDQADGSIGIANVAAYCPRNHDADGPSPRRDREKPPSVTANGARHARPLLIGGAALTAGTAVAVALRQRPS